MPSAERWHQWLLFSIDSDRGERWQTHGVLWSPCSAEEACQRIAEGRGQSTWCMALDLGGGGAFYSLFVPGEDFHDFGNCGYVPIERLIEAEHATALLEDRLRDA